jgi:hypothetical protein
MPLSFYLTLLSFALIGWRCWEGRWRGWGIPALLVLATVSVWYVGDVVYNDYANYRVLFGEDVLSAAWWQVLLFVFAFGLLVPVVSDWVNDSLRRERSHILRIFHTRGFEGGTFQHRLDLAFVALLTAWLVLMGVALLRVKFDFIGLFAPYLGQKADPWGRGRIGGGIDALLALAGYLQIFLVASMGLVAALAKNPRTRGLALLVCFLALPYYLFDRTRNTMLATLMPGLLAWVMLRVRGSLLTKGAILLVLFLAVDGWMRFVMESRGQGRTVAAAFAEKRSLSSDVKHEGLNMFEELAWINSFIADGSYMPNRGQRYFAELVNPVPRVIWKNKPEIGLDYARARGFGWNQAEGAGGGVAASISTGMIGQGIVNFGRILGPVASALLMAFWCALLARQDLLGQEPARLLLYASGLILTFNMGRDITFLVVYPFLFGLGMFYVWQWWRTMQVGRDRRARRLVANGVGSERKSQGTGGRRQGRVGRPRPTHFPAARRPKAR